MCSLPPLPCCLHHPPPTRALRAGRALPAALPAVAAAPEPLSQLHLQVLEPGLCLHKSPGAWISNQAALGTLGLHSPLLSGPFRRVPALHCDTGVMAPPGCPTMLACSHASPSKLFELVCKIFLILLQIFPPDGISLGH